MLFFFVLCFPFLLNYLPFFLSGKVIENYREQSSRKLRGMGKDSNWMDYLWKTEKGNKEDLEEYQEDRKLGALELTIWCHSLVWTRVSGFASSPFLQEDQTISLLSTQKQRTSFVLDLTLVEFANKVHSTTNSELFIGLIGPISCKINYQLDPTKHSSQTCSLSTSPTQSTKTSVCQCAEGNILSYTWI